VFFCRPGRMSLRAVLTGFFDCAHVVCAIADAARNSKAGITKVLFILSSFQFGFQLAFSNRMLCHCYVRLGEYNLRQESDTADNSNSWLNRDRRRTSLENSFTSLRSADSPPPTVAGPVARSIGGSTGCRLIVPSHPVQPP